MRHGGDLTAARSSYGTPPGGWLDLSTGINPHAYPFTPLAEELWRRLPQAEDEARAVAAVRRAYEVAPAAHVTLAAGTQALIQGVAQLRRGAAVSVVAPTYSEHAAAWRNEGADVTEGSAADDSADVVVIVNPNNPDGRRHSSDVLIELSRRLARRGGLLVVDEAFVDCEPVLSLCPHAGEPGLIVLRSFGKFYGLGGVRFGAAIGPARDIGVLSRRLGPWAVPGPSLAIAAEALQDVTWAESMRTRLGGEMAALRGLLQRMGCEVIGGTSLFVLVGHSHAPDLHAALARRGIWVRRFDNEPTWLRFGLPGAGIDRLAAALEEAASDLRVALR